MRERLRAVARSLSAGVRVPGSGRRVKVIIERDAVGGAANTPIADGKPEQVAAAKHTRDIQKSILMRHIAAMLDRSPKLRTFYHPAVELDQSDADAFLEFCNDATVLFEPQAAGAFLRRRLFRLHENIRHADFRDHVARLIAVSDLQDGVVERAERLRTDAAYANDFGQSVARFDAAYGATPPYLAEARTKLDFSGDLRGVTLRWFYENNDHLLRGRRILHIAPERTLEEWLRSEAPRKQFSYETLDGFSNVSDHVCDLTALSLADRSYDLVICHRVLEHILDDEKALSEINRVLSDTGVLDLSVPESPHLARSVEWLVQDSSHHDHVRQYGSDLAARIEQAGFRVEVDQSLLQRTLEEHGGDRTYPLRHYLCYVDR